MLTRAVLGFALLIGFIAGGAWIAQQRQSGQRWVREGATRVHRVVGIVAVACIALFVLTALRLLLD